MNSPDSWDFYRWEVSTPSQIVKQQFPYLVPHCTSLRLTSPAIDGRKGSNDMMRRLFEYIWNIQNRQLLNCCEVAFWNKCRVWCGWNWTSVPLTNSCKHNQEISRINIYIILNDEKTSKKTYRIMIANKWPASSFLSIYSQNSGNLAETMASYHGTGPSKARKIRSCPISIWMVFDLNGILFCMRMLHSQFCQKKRLAATPVAGLSGGFSR